MRLLLFNLRTDIDDTALGFTTAWINALAPRCEHIDVVTLHAGRLDVAANVTVHSVGRERGYPRWRLLARFYRLVIGIVIRRKRRPDVCFAHMTPLFSALFWPVRKLFGVPLLLWYAHGSVTRTLRVAEKLADRCVTSTPAGFRLASTKLATLGQGVDVVRFTTVAQPNKDYERTVLLVGRLTRAKLVDEAIRALDLVRRRRPDLGLRLRIVGGPLTADDEAYAVEIGALVDELALGDAVELLGPVPFARVAGEYAIGGLSLNLGAGALDKAILEAMVAGAIPVSRNTAFGELALAHGLDGLVIGPGVESVADALVRLGSLTPDERASLRPRLRSIVEREHSLERLAGEVRRELDALRRRRTTTR